MRTRSSSTSCAMQAEIEILLPELRPAPRSEPGRDTTERGVALGSALRGARGLDRDRRARHDAGPGAQLPAMTASVCTRRDTVVVPSADGARSQRSLAAGVESLRSLDRARLWTRDPPVERIIERLVELAGRRDVVYVYCGHPIHARRPALRTARAHAVAVRRLPGRSRRCRSSFMAFDIDLTADLDIVDVRSLASGRRNAGQPSDRDRRAQPAARAQGVRAAGAGLPSRSPRRRRQRCRRRRSR